MIDLKAKKEKAVNPEEEKSAIEVSEAFEYEKEKTLLIEMGYPEDRAKAILIETKGNVGMAVSQLNA